MISIKKLQGLSSRRTPGSRVIHYWIPIFIGMTLFLSSFFIVHADNIDHEAREIADQIQEELKYPGEIKVTLIRERRIIEYAR